MRKHRILVAILAFCLVGLVPFATSSATAVEPAGTTAQPAAKVADDAGKAALAKPRRKVAFKFKNTGRTYKFVGKVQSGQNTKIFLMRSKTKKGKYSTFKVGRTSATGSFSWRGLRAPGWFYVKVPANKKWATSVSNLIHVYYI